MKGSRARRRRQFHRESRRVNTRVATEFVVVSDNIMFKLKELAKRLMLMPRGGQKKERDDRDNLAYESENDLRVLGVRAVDVSIGTADDADERTLAKVPNPKTDTSCNSTSECKCRNCRALMNLTECSLCCESLQSNQIQACPVCANVVCIGCCVRLTNCAFCRSRLPPERNRALERLVDKLSLPCKNARTGCKLLVDGESRFMHESLCNHAATSCPVGRNVCGWRGTVAGVQSHLKKSHNLQPLRDHGISVEIHSFRNKARNYDGRVYTVLLACYEQLFIIRVTLYENRLRLYLVRLGHETEQPLGTRPRRYGVSVTVKAQAGRRRHGLVPFGKFDREPREVNVTCEELYRGVESVGDAADINDVVRIDLEVRQMMEA